MEASNLPQIQMSASFSYERLGFLSSEIKLLRIRQSVNGVVQCELTKHSLSSNPEYISLSYVWGDPNITKDILMNEKPFAATTNLVAALEILADELEGSYFIWVDAICIN